MSDRHRNAVSPSPSAVRPEDRRVVITGMGALSPLGLDVRSFWEGLIAGRSGIGPITQFDASGLPVRIAGEVKGFDPTVVLSPKEARRMARCSQFAVVAAWEAVRDAGFDGFPDPERVGTLIGVGMGGYEVADRQIQIFRTYGLSRVSPFALVASIPNMPSHHVSVYFGARGPIATVAAACATGAQAIGEAAEWIRRGIADVVICGGVEALITDFAIAGFAALRALSTRNEEPERASRPFDAHRDGFVYAEGAGVVVLERLSHARARGARIYAEILGYGNAADAHHVAAPEPDGAGAARAMRWALQDAGLGPEDIDYINAHGTSTRLNDPIETAAIQQVFGEHAYRIPISATKSMIGHTMGAAGALGAIAAALTLVHGVIHPTINYETPDPECDLDYVPNVARAARVRHALVNAFGFGGHNVSLVLGRWEPPGP